MLLPLRVYADKYFPKNSSFFHNLFKRANNVYVKIYETAQLTMFYVF
jgi:HKD family nuclease